MFGNKRQRLNVETLTVDNDANVGGNLQVGGTVTASSLNSTSNTISSRIQNANGSSNLPSYTFTNDVNSGLYLKTAGEVGVSCSGNEVLDIDYNLITAYQPITAGTNSMTCGAITSSGQLQLPSSGSGSQPAIIFSSTDTQTGIFRNSAQTISISSGGTEEFRVGNSQVQIFEPLAMGTNSINCGAVTCSSITSSKFATHGIFNQQVGPLPLTSSSFTTGGGTLLIFASGSGYAGSSQVIVMSVYVDSNVVGTCNVRINAGTINEHFPFVSNGIIATGIAAGAHTITLTTTTAVTDGTDYFSVTVLELPF
jgi:hypothetical protein